MPYLLVLFAMHFPIGLNLLAVTKGYDSMDPSYPCKPYDPPTLAVEVPKFLERGGGVRIGT